MSKKTRVSSKPSSLINKLHTYSILSGAKYISYDKDIKNGKPVYGYFPNTKVNRDDLNRIKGKPDRYGKRLIWW